MTFSWGSTNNNNNNTSNNTTFSWPNNGNNNQNNNNNNSNSGGFSWGNNNNNNSQNNNQNTNNNNTGGFSWGNNQNNNNNNQNSNNNNNAAGFSWGDSNNNQNSNNNNASQFNINTSGWANGNNNNNNNNSNTWNNNNNNSEVLNPNNDHIVQNIPSDSISCLKYHPTRDMFSVGSWDNTISVYEHFGSNQSRKLSSQSHQRPVLCSCWDTSSGSSLFSGGCDNIINQWIPQQNSFNQIGRHSAPIRCIQYSSPINCLISGSWDTNLSFWDIRNSQNNRRIYNCKLNSKIYAMSLRDNYLLVALSPPSDDILCFDLKNYQKGAFWSLNNQKQQQQNNGSSSSSSNNKPVCLKSQIRSIDIFPDCHGFAGSSIGGRVIIKHFPGYDTKWNNKQNKKISSDFSFKCHRQKSRISSKNAPISDVFGVNVVKFHSQTGTFITGGDDGEMVIWDKDNRAKLYTFNQIKIQHYRNNSGNNDKLIQNAFMPIVDADYSSNGNYLIYAISYNWNKGKEFYDKTQQKSQIYLHNVDSKEVDKNKKSNN